MKLQNSRFDLLFEDIYNRFQSGGLVTGDVVKFRTSAKSHPFIKGAEPGFKQVIQELMDSDLNLKVGAVRIIRPGVQYLSDGGTEEGSGGKVVYSPGPSALGFLVDLVQEYAPGLWKTPVTVPIEILERVENTGTATQPEPIPDSLRRKERIDIKPVQAPSFKQGSKAAGQNRDRNLRNK